MKTPYSERWISDYFVGVFPQEELDAMIDDSTAQSLEWLENGDDVSWEVFFMLKVLKKQKELSDAIEGEYVSATY